MQFSATTGRVGIFADTNWGTIWLQSNANITFNLQGRLSLTAASPAPRFDSGSLLNLVVGGGASITNALQPVGGIAWPVASGKSKQVARARIVIETYAVLASVQPD